MSSTRSRVLSCFRALHKARLQVFSGDIVALTAGRQKINEEFRKNRSVTDPTAIEELIRTAEDTANYLRAAVVQAKLDESSGTYKVRVTKDTQLLDNAKYPPDKPTMDNFENKTGGCCGGGT